MKYSVTITVVSDNRDRLIRYREEAVQAAFDLSLESGEEVTVGEITERDGPPQHEHLKEQSDDATG